MLKLISTSQSKCDTAANRVKNLINQKYIKRESIDKEATNLLDDSELNDIVQKLSRELADCQITLNAKNKSIELFGTTNSVLEAKSRAHEQITKLNSARIARIQENLRISKNIQWQYQVGSGAWKSFSVYLNSFIETQYGFAKPMVSPRNLIFLSILTNLSHFLLYMYLPYFKLI